jgi:hypothetical protein
MQDTIILRIVTTQEVELNITKPNGLSAEALGNLIARCPNALADYHNPMPVAQLRELMKASGKKLTKFTEGIVSR